MSFTSINGLAGIALGISAAALVLPGVRRLPQRVRLGLAYGAAIVSLIPFGTLPLAAYVRGGTGDLSITTQVLLVLAILRRLDLMPPVDAGRRELLLLVAVAAVGLYPMALGWGLFDPYRLGFGSPWLLAVLLGLVVAAWRRQSLLIVLTIALSVLAWSEGWAESSNLWDYLLDPFLAIYAFAALFRRAGGALAGRKAA